MSLRVWSIAGAMLGLLPAASFSQTTVEARKAYDVLLRENEKLAIAGDAAGMASLRSINATLVDEAGHVLHGRAAIEQEFRRGVEALMIKSIRSDVTDFDSSGPIAYASGIDRVVVVDKATGKEMRDSSRFLVILRQDADGHWRVQYDVASPMPSKK